LTAVYQIANRILYEIIEEEVIALDMQAGTYFSLRNTSAWIWRLLRQPVSLDQIITALTNQYRVDQAIASVDVQAFLVRLKTEGLIEETTAQGSEEIATPLNPNAEPYIAPELEVFTDVQELLTIDPIHDVDEMGWPQPKQMML
jgi:hypothetical protein